MSSRAGAGTAKSGTEDVEAFVIRSSRCGRFDTGAPTWRAGAHLRPGRRSWSRRYFPCAGRRVRTPGAARWGLLAWEDPAVAMAASPFWINAAMPKARFKETDDADPMPILTRLDEGGATLTGLHLLDGALVLRIARGRKVAQVCLGDAAAGDGTRYALSMPVEFEQDFPETLARAKAVSSVV